MPFGKSLSLIFCQWIEYQCSIDSLGFGGNQYRSRKTQFKTVKKTIRDQSSIFAKKLRHFTDNKEKDFVENQDLLPRIEII